MKVRYFADTDTLLLTFSDREVSETFDLNENVLVEVDAEGRVVHVTVEHAAQQTDINEFSFQGANSNARG